MAKRFEIIARHREFALQFVKFSDFELKESGRITLEALVADPEWSVYALDFDTQEALLVRCPAESRIEDEPFLYTAQFNAAVEVAVASWAEFIDAEIPAPKSFVFVHSVGRCGSTLLSKALQVVPGVLSLSEPDDLTQLSAFRTRVTPEQLAQLVNASIRWRGKPSGHDVVAIKTRSEVMMLAPVMCREFPDAKNLFMYRGGISWARSVYRTWPPERRMDDLELNRQMQKGWAQMIPMVDELGDEEHPLNPLEIRLCAWLQIMEGYLNLRASGVEMLAFRYEDLVAEPRMVLESVFAHLGLGGVDWHAADAVLAEDSQKGSFFDREKLDARGMVLTEELIERARKLISRRPVIGTPDVILPGTLRL